MSACLLLLDLTRNPNGAVSPPPDITQAPASKIFALSDIDDLSAAILLQQGK
jgi:hypothetical protein